MMTFKVVGFAVCLTLGFVAMAANAARPNFTYLQAGMMLQNIGENCDQKGLNLGLSYALNSQTFLAGSFSDLEDGNRCGSHNTTIGMGIRSDFGGSSVLYGLGRLIQRDYGRDDDYGAGVELGIRTIFIEGMEINGHLGYEKVDDFDQSFIGVGIDYWVGRGVSINGSFAVNDEDDTSIGLGARLHF